MYFNLPFRIKATQRAQKNEERDCQVCALRRDILFLLFYTRSAEARITIY